MNKVGVVTGATQGLGFALAEGLARRLDHGDTVYLTGRDADRVRSATDRISGQRAKLHGHVLDVCDRAAVDALAEQIRTRHGGVDIVFSNAAARLTPETPWAELVGPFVDTNNLGTTRVLRAFTPLLRPHGRLLVVASEFGSLARLPTPLHRFFDTDAMTLDQIDAVIIGWRNAVIAGHASEDGWPDWINIPSKVGQVAAMRVLARERHATDVPNGILVAAICPGLIDTAASRPWFEDMSEARTPAQAAVAPLLLALDPAVDPHFYGELIQYGKIIPWR